MKDLEPHNHAFGSNGLCFICDAPAPKIPAFMERELLNVKDERLATLTAQLATARAFIEKRDHGQDCKRHKRCRVCDMPHWANAHNPDHAGYSHLFVAGPCTCGYREAMGETK